MKIAFLLHHFSIRGSEIAVYDYAYYNEILLKNTSVILVPNDYKLRRHYTGQLINNEEVENRFRKMFQVMLYTSHDDLNNILIREECDAIYQLKSGEKYGMCSFSVPYLVHCVFTCSEEHKHGEVYAGVSNDILRCNAPVVGHICHKLPDVDVNMRVELGIPDDAVVFGRYGGEETFNIEYVLAVVKKIVSEKENIHFLFMNTNKFVEHPQVHFLQPTSKIMEKARFVSSCDAMLYARDQGESFGLAIAEFTSLSKPIILPKHSKENSHQINMLQDTGIYYTNVDELYHILCNFDKYTAQKPVDYSEIYSPYNVMKLFNNVFLNFSKINHTSHLRLKILCNWTDTDTIHKNYSRQIGKQSVKFVSENPDYYIILNKPPDNEQYDRKKAIVMGMEPDTFANPRWHWYGDKSSFHYFLDQGYHNNWEWWLNKTHTEMIEEEFVPKTKDKVISAIVSNQYQMVGHRLRILFLKEAEKELDFDIYGINNDHGFSSYISPLPDLDKTKGLLPYKYTFAAENTSRINYCTEKLIDGILSECLVFYWGCTNLVDYIDPRCYIWLDIGDHIKSIRTIRQTIENNGWEQRIDHIRRTKRVILDYYTLIPRVLGLVRVDNLDKRTINLDSRPNKWQSHLIQCKLAQLHDVKRFSAIDGSKYDLNSDYIQNLFLFTQNFIGPNKNTNGIVGCALSHYTLWQEVIQNNRPMLVMEDDVTFQPRFVDRLGFFVNMLNSTSDWDVLFVGYHKHEHNCNVNGIELSHLEDNFHSWELVSYEYMQKYASKEDASGLHGGGTFGYLISSKGAKKLLDMVSRTRIYFPIDYYILECGLRYGLKIQVCAHQLLTSLKFGFDTDQSDIQV